MVRQHVYELVLIKHNPTFSKHIEYVSKSVRAYLVLSDANKCFCFYPKTVRRLQLVGHKMPDSTHHPCVSMFELVSCPERILLVVNGNHTLP